jgi:hypothetical protein
MPGSARILIVYRRVGIGKIPAAMGKATVDSILRDEHRQPFHDLVRQPRATIEDAHEWLTKRGYKISRLAVRTYFKSAADEPNHFLGMTEDAQRDLIRNAMMQLKGPSLASLTRYAVYLAGEAAKAPSAAIHTSK